MIFAKRLAPACLFATAFAAYKPVAYKYATSFGECTGSATEIDFDVSSQLIGVESMVCSATGSVTAEAVDGFTSKCADTSSSSVLCSCSNNKAGFAQPGCPIKGALGENGCIQLKCVEPPPPSAPPPSPSPPAPPSPPPPTSPDDDWPCFARNTYAYNPNGEPVEMASLRSGDYVMDGPSTYTRVIVNQHAAVSLKSSLLEIATATAIVSLTPDHVLEVDGQFVPARNAVVGSKLGEQEVARLTSTSGVVINPLTASGKILTQGGILASTYPEWIAEYMLSSALFPLPVSASNMLSYLFPEATQAYYDSVIEGFVTRHHPVHLKAALPPTLLPVAFLLGDIAVAAGFVGFNLASAKGLAVVAVVATAAKANKK